MNNQRVALDNNQTQATTLPAVGDTSHGQLRLKDTTIERGSVLYKCSKYENFNVDEAKKGCSSNIEDWSGQYFALNRDVSDGYGVDYLDRNGKGTVYIHKFEVTAPIAAIEATGSCIVDGSMSGEEKAALIKAQLENKGVYMHGDKLTTALDYQGKVYIGPCDDEDGDRREVILGEKNLDNIRCIETTPILYKDFMPI